MKRVDKGLTTNSRLIIDADECTAVYYSHSYLFGNVSTKTISIGSLSADVNHQINTEL